MTESRYTAAQPKPLSRRDLCEKAGNMEEYLGKSVVRLLEL